MKQTKIKIVREFTIDQVDPRVFGGFMEHMGRCIYEGVYDPESKYADENGFRTDVLDALKQLSMTVMRYPGGNYASGYHWLDGVGPREQRPTVFELAWHSIEPNHIGTDEYIALCRRMDWTPMITVNLGTGTPEEAKNWVEYCNSPAGTKFADMRIQYGNTNTHDVKLWCLGNEMDGPWQIGHVPAHIYAIRAQQAAKIMKDADRTIELVVCGSSAKSLSTYMLWDAEVLYHCWNNVDYISFHCYANNNNNNTADYLAFSDYIDAQIEETASVCRYIQAKCKSKKNIKLCIDEWNVWYKNRQTDGQGSFAPHLIEELYNVEDAIVVAGFLNSFIRHADVVKIANLAQIVNVIAPLITKGDKLLIQTIYYIFRMFSSRKNGAALRLCVGGDTFQTSDGRQVDYVDASAIVNGADVSVFLCNRSIDDKLRVTIDLADAEAIMVKNAEMLSGGDAKAENSFEQPKQIEPFNIIKNVKIEDGNVILQMPALSVAAITFEIK